MPQVDSIDKIVGSYFQCVVIEPFTYKSKSYSPKPLRVSPLLFRNLDCVAKCGACCPRFSLDYLPEEEKPNIPLQERQIQLSSSTSNDPIKIFSNMQANNHDHFCINLDKVSGLCRIHGVHPFSCDFEIIRAFIHKDDPNRISTQQYGRGWNMLRIDGERGTLCGIYGGFDTARVEVKRKLLRLKMWVDHFKLENRINTILTWVDSLDTVPSHIVEFK
jgi:Putative zinc- or iron-chelating domain